MPMSESMPSKVYCLEVLRLALALASILGKKFAVRAAVFASAALTLFLASTIKKLFSNPDSTSASIDDVGKSKVTFSERGEIRDTFLPTIEFNSSKLISRFPSASTLSEVARLKAAFASASSILEADPTLKRS